MNKLNLKNVVAMAVCIAVSMTFVGCDEIGGVGSTAGTTRENAITVGVGHSSSHIISSDSEYWFRFVGTGEPVIFETRGNVVSTFIEVFVGNSRFSQIGHRDSRSGEGYNALISMNTDLGAEYFIRIEPRNGTSGSYTFVVTAPFFNIRTNPIQVSVGYSSPHVINANGTHWFHFQGTGNQVFFETEGNVVGTEITFFEGDDTSSLLQANMQVSFITNAQSTYYIRVRPTSLANRGRAGTYTFRVRHGSGDGSSRHNAIPVAVGYSASHTFNLSTDEHWFTFFGTGESVTFETTGNVVATSIQLGKYWSNRWGLFPNTWTSNQGGEGSNARLTRNTDFGAPYFIRVSTRSGTRGTYTFVVR